VERTQKCRPNRRISRESSRRIHYLAVIAPKGRAPASRVQSLDGRKLFIDVPEAFLCRILSKKHSLFVSRRTFHKFNHDGAFDRGKRVNQRLIGRPTSGTGSESRPDGSVTTRTRKEPRIRAIKVGGKSSTIPPRRHRGFLGDSMSKSLISEERRKGRRVSVEYS